MKKKKFYAVAAGRQTGVFTDWTAAEMQVKGFPGARYKSFVSKEDAEKWLQEPVYSKKKPSPKRAAQKNIEPHKNDSDIVIFTDGGCSNNPGPGGYGAVIVAAGRQVQVSGGYRLTTNNRMELMRKAVQFCCI